MSEKTKKPFYKKWWFWAIVVVILIIGANGGKDDKNTATPADAQVEDRQEGDAEKSKDNKDNQLKFSGEMKATASDGKINVTIETNAIDGSLFEVSVMDGNFNIKSSVLEVKDGKINHDFEIPSDWEPAHFAYNAMFRFNLDDHPQPQNVKDLYGEAGENLKGDLTTENNLGGKNAIINGDTVAYPSQEKLTEHLNKQFNNVIAEMIKVSDGVVLDIKPRSGDWDVVNVVISDAWYYTPKHEQERFAEQVGTTVESIVVNSGKNDYTMVYFVDSYGKDVATPKMLGGWDIK